MIHRPRHKLLVFTIATVAAVTLSSCSGGTSESPSSSDTTLSVGLIAAPANLDYTTTGGVAIPQALLYNVYETLVKIDADGDVVPLLATDWVVSDDLLTYTFTLNDEVTFSNGDPLDADAVKFSFDRVLAGEWTANSPALLTNVLDSVTVVSPTEVAFTLIQPSNMFLFNLASPLGTIFSPNGVDDLMTTAIGSGPYTVSDYQPSVQLTLEQNPDYWGTAPYMTEVTLNYYADAPAQTNALRTGDIDFAFSLPSTESVPEFQSNSDFTVYEGNSTGEVMMAMNNASGPLSDVRVRQAIMYGVDREAVRDATTNGYGLMIGSMVPPSDPWYDESLADMYPFDPERAQDLLAEADATGATLRLRVPSLPYATTAARVIQTQLQDIGLTVEIEELEFPAVWLDEVFSAAGPHDYDLSIIQHSEPRDIFNLVTPGYYLGIQDPEIAATMSAADEAGTQDEFVAGMKTAARMLAEDAVADWLWLTQIVSIADADLQNLPISTTSASLDLTAITR